MPNISLVVPIFNEEENLEELYRRVTAVMDGAGETYELLLVDDGSRDRSWSIISSLAASDPRVRGIRFSRNFGHQMAFTAGLDHARGEVVVIMDGDLQDPPELIPEFLTRWRQGFEVVYGVRASRPGETVFKRWTAAGFYRLLHRATSVDIPIDTGDFRLMGPRAVAAFRRLTERHRFTRGMVSWLGFPQVGVPFQRPVRARGETKYPLRALVRLAMNGLLSFSLLPLQLAGWAGALTVALAGCGLLGGIGWRLLGGTVPFTWLLLGAVLFLGGVHLLALGVLGSYLGRVFEQVQGRPLYLVQETVGGNG